MKTILIRRAYKKANHRQHSHSLAGAVWAMMALGIPTGLHAQPDHTAARPLTPLQGVTRQVKPTTVLAGGGQKSSLATSQHNVVIFVTDGLRAGSVNPSVAPTLSALMASGVGFANSHSLFPTFTTANASAIATGHYLGDTGDFSNTIYTPFPIFNTGNFGNPPGTTTPFVESDQVLSDIDDHFGGSYLTEETLLAYARAAGYSTAAIGKIGPVAIMDVTQLNVDPTTKRFTIPQTVIIDDATGTGPGVPLAADVTTALTTSGVGTVATARNQPSGTNTTPGTTSANIGQQKYFADATAKAVLPLFAQRGVPFALVFWSRDPDGSQHNQGDSLNSLTPGINGPTSKAAITNADNNLAEIVQALKDNGLYDNTDIFVTADHGFNTISHHEVGGPTGPYTNSYAASQTYVNAGGVQDVNTGFTPVGFLAIDLAHDLNLPLYDPDVTIRDAGNNPVSYAPVNATQHAVNVLNAQNNPVAGTHEQHAASGDGLIGGTGTIPQIGQLGGVPVTGANFAVTDAQVVVAANGGSDLIYLPNGTPAQRAALAAQIVGLLSQKDYISGLFADDAFGTVPGALPLTAINFKGSTSLPTPAIVVNFRSFSVDPSNPIQTAVVLADSSLQEGQGMHGSFDRADTFNFMAAFGPDFKSGFLDQSPVSNADVQVTLASLLGFSIPSHGSLLGRVITEALPGSSDTVTTSVGTIRSTPAPNGQRTLLRFQQVGATRYFDAAGYTGRTVGL